jgi:Kef-type K+ transport system membrane component KefB
MIYATAVSGYQALLALALMILVGYGFGKAIEKIKLPEVTGFILAGILMNLLFTNVLPEFGIEVHFHGIVVALEPVITIALGFVSFILGTKFWIPAVKKNIKTIALVVSLQLLIVIAMTTLLFTVFGQPLWFGLIIGGVSAATAGAPIIEISKKYHAKGPLSRIIFPIVGIDNILGISIFLLITVFASSMRNGEALVLASFWRPLGKIGLSLLIGIITGLLLVFLHKRFLCKFFDDEKFETYLVISVGVIVLTTLIGYVFYVSPFIASFVAGAVFTSSLNKESYKYETNVINSFMPPLITAFFVIAGAELSIFDLFRYGGWAILYVVAHAGGKFLGAWLGTKPDPNLPVAIKKNLPTALLTQGGFEIFLAGSIAVYMTIDEADSTMIKAIVLTSVLIFEFFAPLLFRSSLFKAGEAKDHHQVDCPVEITDCDVDPTAPSHSH